MDKEYCKMLEDYVEQLSMALIIDMMKKGIFKDSSEEIMLENKFVKEVKQNYSQIKEGTPEERAVAAVLNALSNYYDANMYEEEILARANIILNFVGDELTGKK
ncbi:hypothetical protein B6U71_02040 [Euryarchaeota archaeon ex4484_178]|nr:MAG: hypothetical protein B6U71_02040 [Euryarchaeota archaeon ex4484_178]